MAWSSSPLLSVASLWSSFAMYTISKLTQAGGVAFLHRRDGNLRWNLKITRSLHCGRTRVVDNVRFCRIR